LIFGKTHFFKTTLWAKPCGSGYPHSLFVKKEKTKELKQKLLSLFAGVSTQNENSDDVMM